MSLWSEQQQRILEAMGYVLFVQPSIASGNAAPSPSASSSLSTHALLKQALVRAVGGIDISALTIDLDALRHDPLQKRRLWPRLRRLLKDR